MINRIISILTALLMAISFVMAGAASTTEIGTVSEALNIDRSQIEFVETLPSEMPGRKAETDGQTIWLDVDNVTNVHESIVHEVSHINAWTPDNWHGSEWEQEYQRLTNLINSYTLGDSHE